MLFWILITLTAALVAVLLALSFRRGRPEATGEADLALYRDQLAEVERDAARGVLSDTEAEAVRTEVARRLLAADRISGQPGAAQTGPLAPALLIGVLAAVTAVFLYQRLGAPDMPDQSRADLLSAADTRKAERPGQEEAEKLFGQPWVAPDGADPAYLDLVAKLRAAMAERPDDLEGWRLLARNEAQLGNFTAAVAAQGKVIALIGGDAPAEEHVALAALMIRAAGGFVSPEAEAVLVKALSIDPKNGMALYYAGVLYAQAGRFDRTLEIWSPLLAASTPEDPWVTPIRSQIEAVAERAGMPYRLPPEAPAAGPSAADVAAAAGMDDAERQQMIRGMVEGLAERLASEGGPAKDWAQLITALGVLGETERAKAIWTEAKTTFAADPESLKVVNTAAQAAGIAG
jgi:cytochrome c-type biogenesis protein CcmH